MKLIDVTLDVSAVPENPMGAGRYVVELARQLTSNDHVRVNIIARRNDEQRWDEMPGSRVSAVVPDSRVARLVWEQVGMPSFLGSVHPHVHHGPHYTIPERAPVPKIATIHDMTFFDHPEWHERTKVPIFRRAIKRATQKAAALIAVSHFTAERLQDRFGELPVTVIPHGVDHDRFRPVASPGEAEADRVALVEAGVTSPFVVFVGTLEPRKDLPTLLKAFDSIAGRHPELTLVLAGRPGWGVDAIEQAMRSMTHANRVKPMGFVADELIPVLLRQAGAVSYPALVEGFGLPALEALACGAPLVTTSGSVMEEVVGDAALLTKPGDVADLAAALNELVTDGATSARLSKSGPVRARSYTWKACGDAHIALYQQVADAVTREPRDV